jgi:hypothetical protein
LSINSLSGCKLLYTGQTENPRRKLWNCSHKVFVFGFNYSYSNDPQFETKLEYIVGLYMSPPENAIVLSVNEKTQIQDLERMQHTMFPPKNCPRIRAMIITGTKRLHCLPHWIILRGM